MISQEKSYILTTLQKLHKNVRDLGKLIVAKGFIKLPKVQKIAQSGHTGDDPSLPIIILIILAASITIAHSIKAKQLNSHNRNRKSVVQ